MQPANPLQVVTREEWLTARKELLLKEKEATRVKDELAKLRTELPLVKVDKTYTFTGAGNQKFELKDLFEGRKQYVLPSPRKGYSGVT